MVNYKVNTVKDGIVTKTVYQKFPQGKVSLCPHSVEINVDHEKEEIDFGYDFLERNLFNVVQNFKDPDTNTEHNICRIFNQPIDKITYEVPNVTPTYTTVHGKTPVLPPEGLNLSGIPVGCQVIHDNRT